tara:strand:- start:1321 stop:1656 length:336 start_codon:yes stop_codon:yes gene_type:complete
MDTKAGSNESGEKGAKIYCFMRDSGNSHQVSWNAAYEIIKRQKSSLFKTSPKHGAVMIIETVVKEPESYQNCGRFLGDLLSSPEELEISNQTPKEEVIDSSPVKKGDRYNY